MGLAPLPCWPMFSDPGPLVRFLLICLGVHRSPCTLVYVYVVSAWLSFGLLLFVRLSPSADTWAPVPRCVICGALGASTQWLARTPSRLTGCYARALSWHSRLLREPATEAPVNGGRNYNGPKMRTTRTWTERPYEALLFPGIGFGLFLRSLGGRRRRPPSGGARAISEIPLWKS
ncbi:hypothetical protein V6N12_035393 [Hibiscus sabdariffa]|uniref:Uncharacterized protein n=1 Tax=Hibiscus sabdariffa TaxID=183260 RepID=A0ABR2EMM6_9ROSI